MTGPIFLVVGTCGECSDRSEWNVCWFPTKERAEAYAQKCREADACLGSDDRYDSNTVAASMIRRLDPAWFTNYTGTQYSVVEVPDGTDAP